MNETPIITAGGVSRPPREIHMRAATLAEALVRLGIGKGDAVALISRNGLCYFEVEQALRSLDGFVVPLNWHQTAGEVGYILRDANVSVVIGQSDLLQAVDHEIDPKIPRIVIDGVASGKAASWHDYEDLLTATGHVEARTGSGLESSIIYTSGTTGKPKGVRRLPKSLNDIAVRREALNQLYPSRPGARALVTGPQYHLFSLAVSMTYFGAGASVVVMDRFDAETFLALIEKHGITHTHLVPTMMVRLLRLPANIRARYDLSSLEFLIHSGSPCADDIKQQMIEWLGPLIWESYGSSETGAVTMISSEEWLQRPGSVGKPFATGEVRIYDLDGNRLGPGATGEVYTIMHGTPDFTYHGNEAARERIGRDGLVATGDLGYVDDDGYLYICDRRADMVISGGVNIYPAEIEAALLAHPDIVDAAVFGIPDAEFGESLAAHLKLVDNAEQDESAIRNHLRERLASYKVPRHIVFEAELPRLANGKILKRALRDPYWAGEKRRV